MREKSGGFYARFKHLLPTALSHTHQTQFHNRTPASHSPNADKRTGATSDLARDEIL